MALPEFFFTQDRKTAPLLLLGLVGGGILLPLSIVSWYILSKKDVGPNGIREHTLQMYARAIKESMVGAARPGVAWCAVLCCAVVCCAAVLCPGARQALPWPTAAAAEPATRWGAG